MQETHVQFLSREDPLERKWQPTPVFFRENPVDRGAWWATVHGVTRVGHDLVTKPPPTVMRVPTNNPSLMPALGAHGVLIE